MKLNELIDFLLLSRPYTLPSIVLVTLLGSVLARKALIFDSVLVLSVIFGIFTWFAVIYFHEALLSTHNRMKISVFFPILFIGVSLIISLIYNYYVLLLLFFVLITSNIYRLKSYNWIGSGFVFVFRGFTEMAIFLSVVFFHFTAFTWYVIITSLIIFMLTVSRNLIGDIRDFSSDKFTFPRLFGKRLAYFVSVALLLFSIILTPDIYISIPLIFVLIMILFYRRPYFLHHLYVLASIFYLINYIFFFLTYSLFLSNLAFFAVILTFTYKFVPRKVDLNSIEARY